MINYKTKTNKKHDNKQKTNTTDKKTNRQTKTKKTVKKHK